MKPVRRKPAAAALAALLVAVALTAAGCGGQTNNSASAGTLTVDWQPDYRPNMDWLIKQFEKEHPKAHVKVSYVDQSQYFSLLRTQLQAGTAPDVFWTTPGNGNPTAMAVLAKAGYLTDLSNAPWVNTLRPAIKKYGQLDGKTYSLQTNISAFGVLYNDQAMAKQGLTAPTNWNQVLSFCAAARKKGVVAYAMGAQDLFFTQQFIYSTLPTMVYKTDASFDRKMDSGTTTFPTSAGWQVTMAKYKQALDAGCFTDRPAGTSFTTAVSSLAAGKALGVIGAYLFSSPAQAANPAAHYSFGAFPAADDPWLMIGAFGGTGVNAKSKNPALAKAFVDFLGRPDIMRGYSAQGTGSLPTIVGNKPFTTDKPGLRTIEKYLDAGKSVTFVDQNWPNPEVQQAMYESTQAMLVGRGSPSDVLAAMQKKWTKP